MYKILVDFSLSLERKQQIVQNRSLREGNTLEDVTLFRSHSKG